MHGLVYNTAVLLSSTGTSARQGLCRRDAHLSIHARPGFWPRCTNLHLHQAATHTTCTTNHAGRHPTRDPLNNSTPGITCSKSESPPLRRFPASMCQPHHCHHVPGIASLLGLSRWPLVPLLHKPRLHQLCKQLLRLRNAPSQQEEPCECIGSKRQGHVAGQQRGVLLQRWRLVMIRTLAFSSRSAKGRAPPRGQGQVAHGMCALCDAVPVTANRKPQSKAAASLHPPCPLRM